PREDPEHVVRRPAAAGLAGLLAEHEILPDRQARENIPRFRDIAEAAARGLVRLDARDLLAFEANGALRADVAHHRLDRRRAADAVAPEQTDDFVPVDPERDAVQNMALAVIGVETHDLEQRRSHRPAPCPR